MRWSTSILILLVSLSALGQDVEVPPPSRSTPYRLGIKTGINFSTLLGSELKNPRPRFGYSGGMYLNYPLKRSLLIHSELMATMRGSRFGNPSGSYQQINMFTFDLPILLGRSLRKDRDQIMAGLQVSTLLLSAVYLDPKGKVHQTDLGLHPVFLDAVVAYQAKSGVAGYQLALKGSVLDMNKDLYLEGIEPSTAHDGSIYNLSFELSLIF